MGNSHNKRIRNAKAETLALQNYLRMNEELPTNQSSQVYKKGSVPISAFDPMNPHTPLPFVTNRIKIMAQKIDLKNLSKSHF